MNVISIGEVLWDVVGPTGHLGGAPFNFSAHLSKLGHNVSFISGVGSDPRGQRVLEQMAEQGLSSQYVRRVEDYPTGIATVTLYGSGQPEFVIKRPAAYDFPQLTAAEFQAILSQRADWFYYGTLQQMSSTARELSRELLDSKCAARNFYDLNLRKHSYEPSLVEELMSRATIVKLNDTEVDEVMRIFGNSYSSLEEFCRCYSAKFGWEAVCVTRGAKGCALLMNDDYYDVPGYAVEVVDTVGAGDAFAAAFVHGFGSGWSAWEIGDFANRLGALIASRRGAIPPWTMEEIQTQRSL
ncbi:MAG: PfkB domain protein [Acidobacteriaceae bacterium]|nr:PfkB domain protein [Acidobacteriaceae bacterium]